VMGEFAERDPAHVAARDERLADAVAAALARREGPRAVDPDYLIPRPGGEA